MGANTRHHPRHSSCNLQLFTNPGVTPSDAAKTLRGEATGRCIPGAAMHSC